MASSLVIITSTPCDSFSYVAISRWAAKTTMVILIPSALLSCNQPINIENTE